LNEEKQRIKGLLVFLLLLFVAALPASMSRTAWIASFCGTLYVIVSHYGWLEKMKQMKRKTDIRKSILQSKKVVSIR